MGRNGRRPAYAPLHRRVTVGLDVGETSPRPLRAAHLVTRGPGRRPRHRPRLRGTPAETGTLRPPPVEAGRCRPASPRRLARVGCGHRPRGLAPDAAVASRRRGRQPPRRPGPGRSDRRGAGPVSPRHGGERHWPAAVLARSPGGRRRGTRRSRSGPRTAPAGTRLPPPCRTRNTPADRPGPAPAPRRRGEHGNRARRVTERTPAPCPPAPHDGDGGGHSGGRRASDHAQRPS